MADNEIDQISVIKYYMDKIEKGDIENFAVDREGNAVTSIYKLLELFNQLTASSSHFRMMVLRISEGNSDISIPSILNEFFKQYLNYDHGGFTCHYPLLNQMLDTTLRI